tara:strand:- start:135 stop:512 length:378 start_codon:yes stop_codon:yes gene_type:complete
LDLAERMTNNRWIQVAAVSMIIAVGLGALGAHLLDSRLEANGTLSTWKTAVLYQMVHGLAVLALALSGRLYKLTGWCFLVGTLCFSGSLYGLSLGGPAILGPVTPLGGVLFLVGWLSVVLINRKC